MRFRYFAMTLAMVIALSGLAIGQTTAFNFQGRLNDGSSPANGRFDLQFKLFTAIAGGSQAGVTVDRPNLVLINGVFSTVLDFGGGAFNGPDRFIEISVRPNGSPNAYVVLGARQQILSVPYAVKATNASNADNATNSQNAVNATNSVNATNATTAQNSLSLGGVVANGYARLNFPNLGDIAASNLASGGGLSVGGNATQLGSSFGIARAMVVVNDDLIADNVVIERCYNGLTGASTPATCGFTVVGNGLGVYQVNFGVAVNNRFVSAIGRYDSGGGAVGNNIGVSYQFDPANAAVIAIFTFNAGDADDTTRADFILILY